MSIISDPPRDWKHYTRVFQDAAYWQPLLHAVARREVLDMTGARLAQPAGTNPTFLSADVVVKCYATLADGEAAWRVEAAVLAAANAACVPSPPLLAADTLTLAGQRYWYVVQGRVLGEPLSAARDRLSPAQLSDLAADLGRWCARLHAVPAPQVCLAGASAGAEAAPAWYAPEHAALAGGPSRCGAYSEFLVAQRARLSDRLAVWGSLPERLIAQAPAFCERWLVSDGNETLVHADLHHDHVFLGEDGRACALIDFADARLGNPWYELGPLVISCFSADPVLLRSFLAGYEWPVADAEQFACRALATALCHDYDMFEARRDLPAAASDLDDLAAITFAPQP